MRIEHTPASWRVEGGAVVDSRDNIVATRHAWAHLTKDPSRGAGAYIAPAEADANARLIAAAPDLLEVLEAVLAEQQHGIPDEIISPELQEQASAAIAKARGEL